jgi:hypothetical protein
MPPLCETAPLHLEFLRGSAHIAATEAKGFRKNNNERLR